MNTYASLCYHLIFRTLDGAPLLVPPHDVVLCRVLNGTIRDEQGVLLQASSQPDHVHLLVSLRPTRAVADVVRNIKSASSKWLNEDHGQKGWFRWEPGYGAFSVSESETQRVRRFIERQQQFHQKTTLDEEFLRIVEKHGMTYDDGSGEYTRRTYACLYVHVVFSTKLRLPLISEAMQAGLYQKLGDLATSQRAELVEIGGIEDHVHMILAMHRSVPVADVMRPIKNESTYWMRAQLGDEPMFAWQRGYGVFSVSSSQLPKIRRYVQRQKEHHRETTFEEELHNLLVAHGLNPSDESANPRTPGKGASPVARRATQ